MKAAIIYALPLRCPWAEREAGPGRPTTPEHSECVPQSGRPNVVNRPHPLRPEPSSALPEWTQLGLQESVEEIVLPGLIYSGPLTGSSFQTEAEALENRR